MANRLLDRVSPEELANNTQTFETKGKIGDFGRLVEIVEADLAEISAESRPANWRTSPVQIRLKCAWADDRQEVPALSGCVSARIAAVCQRCLEPFELAVETEINLLMLRSAEDLPGNDNVEVWQVEEDTIRPLDIIEESLVMALPLAAMHEPPDLCGPLTRELRADGSADVVRPFADLRTQMDKSN